MFRLQLYKDSLSLPADSTKNYIHSKKCWVKYNPVLGNNPAIGLFWPSSWDKHLTQLLVENNPECVLCNIYPALGCI